MPPLYDDFDLMFQRDGDGYVVHLLNSPAGQATGHFNLPFTEVQLRNFYGRIGQFNRTMRGVDSLESVDAKEFGRKLFRATFSESLLVSLRASVAKSSSWHHDLRIRFRFTDVPELAELPWEFLYDAEQNYFVATSKSTPVVRYLALPQGVSTLRVPLPLRILVIIAAPRGLPRIDSIGELKRLESSLQALKSQNRIEIKRLEAGTLDALRERCCGLPFHILHFIGHGRFDRGANDGIIYFENRFGEPDPVSGEELGTVLRDHKSLRLAVLNACEGARSSLDDPFSGVAQNLCRHQLPAVVAMQFEISDDAAKTFAGAFYSRIADGYPVDAAITESRRALLTARLGQEWATPVLYMRSSDGLLFDIGKPDIVSRTKMRWRQLALAAALLIGVAALAFLVIVRWKVQRVASPHFEHAVATQAAPVAQTKTPSDSGPSKSNSTGPSESPSSEKRSEVLSPKPMTLTGQANRDQPAPCPPLRPDLDNDLILTAARMINHKPCTGSGKPGLPAKAGDQPAPQLSDSVTTPADSSRTSTLNAAAPTPPTSVPSATPSNPAIPVNLDGPIIYRPAFGSPDTACHLDPIVDAAPSGDKAKFHIVFIAPDVFGNEVLNSHTFYIRIFGFQGNDSPTATSWIPSWQFSAQRPWHEDGRSIRRAASLFPGMIVSLDFNIPSSYVNGANWNLRFEIEKLKGEVMCESPNLLQGAKLPSNPLEESSTYSPGGGRDLCHYKPIVVTRRSGNTVDYQVKFVTPENDRPYRKLWLRGYQIDPSNPTEGIELAMHTPIVLKTVQPSYPDDEPHNHTRELRLDGLWNPGVMGSFEFILPKEYTDPSEGWSVEFQLYDNHNSKTCSSENLLWGEAASGN